MFSVSPGSGRCHLLRVALQANSGQWPCLGSLSDKDFLHPRDSKATMVDIIIRILQAAVSGIPPVFDLFNHDVGSLCSGVWVSTTSKHEHYLVSSGPTQDPRTPMTRRPIQECPFHGLHCWGAFIVVTAIIITITIIMTALFLPLLLLLLVFLD